MKCILLSFFLCSLVYSTSGICLPWTQSSCTDVVSSDFGGEFPVFASDFTSSVSAFNADLQFVDDSSVSTQCKTAVKKALCVSAYNPCDNCQLSGRQPCKTLCDAATGANGCTGPEQTTLGITGKNPRPALKTLANCGAAPWSSTTTGNAACYNGATGTLRACPSVTPSVTPSITPTISVTPTSSPPPPSVTPSPTRSLGSSASSTQTVTATASMTPSVTPSVSVSSIPVVGGSGKPVDINDAGGQTTEVVLQPGQGASVFMNIVGTEAAGFTYTINVIEGSVIRMDCAGGDSFIITVTQSFTFFCPLVRPKRNVEQSSLQMSFVTGANGARVVVAYAPLLTRPSPSNDVPRPSAGGDPVPAPPAPPGPAPPGPAPAPGASPDPQPPRQSAAPPAPEKPEEGDSGDDSSSASILIPSAVSMFFASLAAIF